VIEKWLIRRTSLAWWDFYGSLWPFTL